MASSTHLSHYTSHLHFPQWKIQNVKSWKKKRKLNFRGAEMHGRKPVLGGVDSCWGCRKHRKLLGGLNFERMGCAERITTMDSCLPNGSSSPTPSYSRARRITWLARKHPDGKLPGKGETYKDGWPASCESVVGGGSTTTTLTILKSSGVSVVVAVWLPGQADKDRKARDQRVKLQHKL